MGLFHIEEERPGNRIFAGGDGLKGRYLAFDGRTLDLVGVLIEEREAEDAEGLRIGLQFLDDQVVVFTGLDDRRRLPGSSRRSP